MAKRPRPLTLAPLTVDEALAALLQTPPMPTTDDEIAARQVRDTKKLVAESRKLIATSKERTKRKGKGRR
jgi:hypothetical protein